MKKILIVFLSSGFMYASVVGAYHAGQRNPKANWIQTYKAIEMANTEKTKGYDKGYSQGWSDAHCGTGNECEAGQE